jgi:tRNA threonylcarbamoyladenosine biosynthesis protein TsaE
MILCENKPVCLKNLREMAVFAGSLAEQILSDKSKNIIFLFKGGMGAGKTTFIKNLGMALGIKSRITSPTFIGQSEYHNEEISLYHLDAYQVAPDYETLYEIFELEKKKVFAIEWSENLDKNILDLFKYRGNVYNIDFKVAESGTRSICLEVFHL